jgi:hypothetical protein
MKKAVEDEEEEEKTKLYSTMLVHVATLISLSPLSSLSIVESLILF